jgi:hypothetical protein
VTATVEIQPRLSLTRKGSTWGETLRRNHCQTGVNATRATMRLASVLVSGSTRGIDLTRARAWVRTPSIGSIIPPFRSITIVGRS